MVRGSMSTHHKYGSDSDNPRGAGGGRADDVNVRAEMVADQSREKHRNAKKESN